MSTRESKLTHLVQTARQIRLQSNTPSYMNQNKKNSPQAVSFFTLQSLILPREGQRFPHRQQQQESPQSMAVQS